jgi:outer membrane lipoprotein SlyB
MGKCMKAAKAVVAALAWFAAHTSFANEIDSGGGPAALSKSGAVAGASAGAMSGAGATANGSQTVNGGNARAIGLGAAVSPATCYGSVLGGIAVWSSDECIRDQQFRQLMSINDVAAREFLCQNVDQRRALVAAGYECRTRAGAVMPVFQTGSEGDAGYGPYNPFQRVQ